MNEKETNPAENATDRTLVLTRVFAAQRHLVFEAWTKKEHLDRWTAPKGFTVPFSEAELRPGGHLRVTMVAPDSTEHKIIGTYREIIPNELLVFKHTWETDDGQPGHETLVTVRFADHGDGQTLMTFEQGVFATKESRDNHHGGWSECFEKLADLLASEP